MLKSDNKSSSLTNYLLIASHEENTLSGALHSLFGDSDDDENDTSESVFTPASNWVECSVPIGKHLNIRIVQAPSAFHGAGGDDTGSVLWGASLHLANFLSEREPPHDASFLTDRRIVELGCGCGLVSIAVAKLGAERVVATDFCGKTLSHVSYHSELNDITDDTLGVERLDWENRDRCLQRDMHHAFDVVLASDVIYGMDKVMPLIRTIEELLVKNECGVVIVATRDGRRGVDEFVEMMQDCAGFRLDQRRHIIWGKNGADEEEVPSYFNEEGSIGRWKGDHSIYVFRRSLSTPKIV